MKTLIALTIVLGFATAHASGANCHMNSNIDKNGNQVSSQYAHLLSPASTAATSTRTTGDESVR